MGFPRGVKCPFEILSKRLNGPFQLRQFHSTLISRGKLGNEIGGSSNPCVSRYSNRNLEIGFPLRSYSTDVSAVDQISLIKLLRERTSAPIKEVKAALVGTNWDIDAAQKELRKRGVVLASKKSSRTAAEGLLALAQNERRAALVELNCETDFVARNEIFQYLALSLARSALLVEGSQQASGSLPFGPEFLEGVKLNLDHPKLNGERTVQNAITEIAAMMGEHVKMRRGFAIANPSQGIMATYLHTSPQQGIGRIAGILSLEVENPNAPLDAVRRIGSELAMHVVAAKPLFLTREDVSSDALENEREILKSQAESTGKPAMAIEKMVEGRLRKYYEDVVLMEQKFVVNDKLDIKAESTGKPAMAIEKMVEGRLRKYYEDVVLMEQKFVVNDKLDIKTVLSNLAKEVGSPVKIGSFLRVEVGEGLHILEECDGAEPSAQVA